MRNFLVSSALVAALTTSYALAQVANTTGLSYLHVSGRQLVAANGKSVVLRGFNLGSWLETESWMDGSTGKDGRARQEVLEARFGPALVARLMFAWRDRWITASDLDLLKSWGVNALRVPLDYRAIVGPGGIDANGVLHGAYLHRDPTTLLVTPTVGVLDFRFLDWIVAKAGARGIYVIFDLHSWEGQLSGPGADPYQQISCFCTGADTERDQAALLWTAVATHFKGNGTIAGMDVINEPGGSPDDTVQKQLLEGVRNGDPNRVGFIESVWLGNFAPTYPNSVYSTHYPPLVTQQWVDSNLVADAPNYIGEFQIPSANPADVTTYVKALNAFGLNWTVWTYKGVSVGGWAMFDYYSTVAQVDPATSTARALLAAWTTPLTLWRLQGQNENSYLNTSLIEAYSAQMKAP